MQKAAPYQARIGPPINLPQAIDHGLRLVMRWASQVRSRNSTARPSAASRAPQGNISIMKVKLMAGATSAAVRRAPATA